MEFPKTWKMTFDFVLSKMGKFFWLIFFKLFFTIIYSFCRDFLIKCPDESIQASRQSLYISSHYFRNLLPTFQSHELAVRHSIDVVKPIIYYLHSLCFETPKFEDIGYIRRLITAICFFLPVNKNDIMVIIQRSLCQKLVDVRYHIRYIILLLIF